MGIQYLDGCNRFNEEEKESLLMMYEASTCMGETLNEVLNLQKIEEGKLKLEYSPFSIQKSITEVVHQLQAPIKKNGIIIDIRMDETLSCRLIGDHCRIENIITNFLSNAIKFSPKGSIIMIRVTWKDVSQCSERPTIEIIVEVLDQGTPIPKEYKDVIFTSHMSNNRSDLSQGARGTGVGLSISRELAQLHGGEVQCTSERERGNTFSFRIPFQTITEDDVESSNSNSNPNHNPDHNPVLGERREVIIDMNETYTHIPDVIDTVSPLKPSSSPSSASETLSSISLTPSLASREPSYCPLHSSVSEAHVTVSEGDTVLKRERERESTDLEASLAHDVGIVLVVDDVMSNRKMLKLLLRKKGVTVEMAEDGREALSIVQSKPGYYSMIFMDNMMPYMNGMEVTSVLRREGFDRMIIGLTGCAMDDDIKKYVDAGADLVLTKPMNITALDSVLRLIHQQGTKSYPHKQLKFYGEILQWTERE
eukprot:CAMPEP_0182419394 /NCGR_PEP_ID=MMETSP1167-20130531/3864_1 /TAXON_ID=2988 /ORGANISM="Mallomonas Sp, Strain CCMP3275" /LENGTH=479 /DNA_ID=CAMNT_0024594303 /DNA_START=177 /DNA_END=1616 /DNA_ORIENTATION=-